jgi:hypothetical protein
MAIELECPACFEKVRLEDSAAGQVVRCGVCMNTFRAPGRPPAATRAEPPPDVPVAEVVAEPPPPRSKARPVAPPRPEPRREPARRRRRPERRADPDAGPSAAPQGRGAAFWTAFAVCLGLFVGVSFGAAAFVFATPSWREHESAAGGFTVELPAGPRQSLPRFGDAPAGTRVEGTALALLGEEFTVCYSDIPPERRRIQSDDAILKEGVAELARIYPGCVVTRDEPLTVSNFPARELVIDVPGKGLAVARLVVAEDRRFLVIAGGDGVSYDNPRVRRFLDSFAVTDPVLLAKAKDRKDAAQKGAAQVAAAQQEQAEVARKANEAKQAMEKKRKEENEAKQAKERDYLASLEKARDEFRTAGRAAPDPYLVPGLVLHLGFDGPDPMWPKSAGKLDIPAAAVAGPGPRGSALYLPAHGRVTLREPADWLRAGLAESVTLSGWVKLRYRPLMLVQVGALNGRVIGHLTVGGNRIVLNTKYDRDDRTDHTAPSGGSRAVAPWQRDDQWHHVAAVRERGPAGERAVLYLDGRAVAEHPVTVGNWSDAGGWTFAHGLDIIPEAWTGPSGPPDRDGKPMWPGPTEIAYAVDEICLYDRALTAAEVRLLAGVDPVPAGIAKRQRPADPTVQGPPSLSLTPGTALPRLTGIGFDPGRAVAWAVTDGPSSDLIKLSYPDLKPLARYHLPGPAGPVAFDSVENRLFVVVRPPDGRPTPPPPPGDWPVGYGMIHRYDLAELPPPAPGQRPQIKPAASTPTPRSNPVTALAVTPDGNWVCAALRLPSTRPPTSRVFKIPSHLQPAEGALSGRGLGDTPFPYRLVISPRGDTIWFPNWGGVGDWNAVDFATEETDRVSFRHQPATERDWAVHPDGDRGYIITDDGGAEEAKPVEAGQTGHRRRPLLPGHPRANLATVHLGLTVDGRFLFHTAQSEGRALLTVVDTTARGSPPGQPPPASAVINNFPGPFWVSPDGAVVVSRSGQVVGVGYPAGLAPVPRPPAPRPRRIATAPWPRPRVAAAPYTGDLPPPPSEFPGLKFHLAFDEDNGFHVRESVSGKLTVNLIYGQYVDGVRGKALRLSYQPRSMTPAPRLDLKSQTPVLGVPADTPFTLALWVRAVEGRGTPFQASRTIDGKVHGLFVESVATPSKGQELSVTLGARGKNDDPEHAWSSESPTPGAWRHVAIVREGNGTVRVLVNGEEAPRVRGNGRFTDALEFDWVYCLVSSGAEPATVDIDDLCVFDRALTEGQLRRLAAASPVKNPRPSEAKPAPAAVAKGPSIHPYTGRPLSPAGELKGLTFHLPLTSMIAGKTPEAVSLTDLPVGTGTALVDGVRGKALRFTPSADRGAPACGMDLSGGAALKAAAGKPFTLATWVRVVDPDQPEAAVVLGASGDGPQPTREFVLQMAKGEVELRLNDRTAPAKPGVRIAGKTTDQGQWFHLAVTRDDAGRVRLLVDGEAVEAKGESVFPHAIGYDRVRLAVGPPRAAAMDLAEFGFFDRALTDAEVKTLAGAR